MPPIFPRRRGTLLTAFLLCVLPLLCTSSSLSPDSLPPFSAATLVSDASPPSLPSQLSPSQLLAGAPHRSLRQVAAAAEEPPAPNDVAAPEGDGADAAVDPARRKETHDDTAALDDRRRGDASAPVDGDGDGGGDGRAGEAPRNGTVGVEVGLRRNETAPGAGHGDGARSAGADAAGAANATVAAGKGKKEEATPLGKLKKEDEELLAALNVSVVEVGVAGTEKAMAVVRGNPAGKFESCALADDADAEKLCDVVDEVVDRSTVELRFNESALESAVFADAMKNFKVERLLARVASSGGRADPVVVGPMKVDEAAASVSFVVKYMCRAPEEGEKNVNATSLVSAFIPVSVSGSVLISWAKRCGSGDFANVNFGYLDHDQKTVLFHHDGTHGDSKDVGLEVSPHDLSTVLTLALTNGVRALDFRAPYVTSSRPDVVRFSVRGAAVDGSLSLTPKEPAEVSIMYECKAAVSANFRFTIAIPPWNNLTASWTKDCGGQVPKSLLIGTSVAEPFDVLHDGELSPAYNVSSLIGSPDARRPDGVKKIDSNTHHNIFYVSNADMTSDVHIQSVTITSEPSNVVFVVVETPTVQPLIGGGYITKAGGVVGRKQSKRLSLQYYCRATGSATVLVTLSTLLYQNIEFGFVKDCVEGRVFHQSALTAGSLMSALFLAAMGTAVMGCWYFVRKRRREAALLDAAVGKGRRKGNYTLVDDAGLDF